MTVDKAGVERARIGVPARFAAKCEAIVRCLPFGLDRLMPATFLGFCLLNGFTFAVDLTLLTVFHGVLDWPVPIAVTIAYVIAFALSFVLNRTFNFRSHAPIGPQAGIYVVAVIVNYLAFVLGVGSGLVCLGFEYHLARLTAGACEGAFMYSVMRWVLFRT